MTTLIFLSFAHSISMRGPKFFNSTLFITVKLLIVN
jgi:hypothetical protein